MKTAHIFDALHSAGLRVSLAPGGKLVVSPGRLLTAELRELVQKSKPLLVSWLQSKNAPAYSEPQGLDNHPLEPPADQKDWHELAQAYYSHHFKCVVCIAASRGGSYGLRCGAGAGLWNKYENAQ